MIDYKFKVSCPDCKNNYVGQISLRRFFCPECCIEFTIGPKFIEVYNILTSGEIVKVDSHLIVNSF